jgi:hypothetical protein
MKINLLVLVICGGESWMAKKGAKYKCEECGLVVVVDAACGCAPCDLICCGVPMKEQKATKPVAKAKIKAKAKK